MNLSRLALFLKKKENRLFLKQLYEQYPVSINQTARFLSLYPDFPIHDLLTLIRLQKRNEEKNPHVHQFIFDEKGIEQSSSWKMAEYHSEKMKNYLTIADLCCGIGIDLVHFAKSEKQIFAVDTDAQKLEAAKFNVESFSQYEKIEFLNQHAEDFSQSVDAIFIDPDRRFYEKRTIEPEMMSPPLSKIMQLTKLTPNIIIKLSPVFDYKKLQIEQKYSLEFVSENGNVKEILLCLGEFAKLGVRNIAVLLPENIVLDDSMETRECIHPISSYLFEPDAAIIRSGLIQQCAEILSFNRIHSQIALLTGDEIRQTKMGVYFKVEEIFGYQLKRLQKYLKAKEIGTLEIKTRGFAIPVEEFRKKLKLRGKNQATLFIIRLTEKHICVISKRISEKAC